MLAPLACPLPGGRPWRPAGGWLEAKQGALGRRWALLYDLLGAVAAARAILTVADARLAFALHAFETFTAQ